MDYRVVLNGIFWILNTGSEWRHSPERHGKWGEVRDGYRELVADGTIRRVARRLKVRLDQDALVEPGAWHDRG